MNRLSHLKRTHAADVEIIPPAGRKVQRMGTGGGKHAPVNGKAQVALMIEQRHPGCTIHHHTVAIASHDSSASPIKFEHSVEHHHVALTHDRGAHEYNITISHQKT